MRCVVWGSIAEPFWWWLHVCGISFRLECILSQPLFDARQKLRFFARFLGADGLCHFYDAAMQYMRMILIFSFIADFVLYFLIVNKKPSDHFSEGSL